MMPRYNGAMTTVLITPGGWRFEASPGQSVLEAAEAAGVVLPSSCRNGTCRTCLCQMTAGAVRYRIAWPGLSFDERREGCILPCVAEASAPLTLLVPAARKPD